MLIGIPVQRLYNNCGHGSERKVPVEEIPGMRCRRTSLRLHACNCKGIFVVIYPLMERTDPETFDLKKMIADYMEGGLLDNIVDMYKHDAGLYQYVGDLMTDERMRVRIGATALMEILGKEDPENISRAVPFIVPLLKDENPVTRGDAAYTLGLIGTREAMSFLHELTNDENADVRAIAAEAIQDINGNLQAR